VSSVVGHAHTARPRFFKSERVACRGVVRTVLFWFAGPCMLRHGSVTGSTKAAHTARTLKTRGWLLLSTRAEGTPHASLISVPAQVCLSR
jgi:hypothetical protein